MLNSLGIKNRLRNLTLSLTTKGKYSIGSEIRIDKKTEVLKFYKKINFSLSNKRKRFKKFLIKSKWI